MSEINVYVGAQIRKYRKACKLTIQELADAIHKSRATVCKYENGTISIDIETLYEISQVLQVLFPAEFLPADGGREGYDRSSIWKKESFFSGQAAIFLFL